MKRCPTIDSSVRYVGIALVASLAAFASMACGGESTGGEQGQNPSEIATEIHYYYGPGCEERAEVSVHAVGDTASGTAPAAAPAQPGAGEELRPDCTRPTSK